MINNVYDFRDHPEADLAFLRLLLHQRGMPYSTADRALAVYEMRRRLSDERERLLLLEYGYENIAEDIFMRRPLGEQWHEYEEALFSLRERALSRCYYHILARAFEQQQEQDAPTHEEDLEYDQCY